MINVSKGAYSAQTGTVVALWRYVYTDRWSIPAHRFACGVPGLAGDPTSWWGVSGLREATFGLIEGKYFPLLGDTLEDANRSWTQEQWKAALGLWAILQGSRITDLPPEPEPPKDGSEPNRRFKAASEGFRRATLRKETDAVAFRAVGLAIRDRLRSSFEQYRSGPGRRRPGTTLKGRSMSLQRRTGTAGWRSMFSSGTKSTAPSAASSSPRPGKPTRCSVNSTG